MFSPAPCTRPPSTARQCAALRLSNIAAFLILFLVSPTLLHAQFKEPTQEELKMTADPKAPGAAAVYLDIVETYDDPLHVQNFYARIKVLQEKGKELATVEIPYLHGATKVEGIEARTIHSDGTVIPLLGKPEDLLTSKSKSKQGYDWQINRMVFTLPSVEVGSILEYHYRLSFEEYRSSEPIWEVQRPYFVHHERFFFKPFKAFLTGIMEGTGHFLVDSETGDPLNSLIWWSILPNNTAIKPDIAGTYRLELTDIPATPNEEFMPPIESLLYRVQFYYKNANSSQNFWIDRAKRWSKEVDHFAEPNKSIREAVAGLIAPTDSDIDKARKLYQAVQALDNTDFSRQKNQAELKRLHQKVARRAEDTWVQKSGDSNDIALLYLAMLRAAGLTAYDMKVADRSRHLFDISYLNFKQFDDDIVILNTGGKEILLDPGEKMCPFQTVNWRHSSAKGVRQNAGEQGVTETPEQAYTDNKTVRTGDITFDDHGSITGVLRFSMTGQEALRWRQIAIRNDLDEVKKQFDHSLESLVPDGVEAHVDHFVGLDDSYSNLVAVVKIRGTLGVVTSKRILIPGFFFETRGGHPFVGQEKRLEPVDMHYDEQVNDQIVYHLPANLTVEGAPQDTKIPWADHAAYATKVVSVPGKITIVRQFARAFTIAKPEEYNDLRGFYQKVAAADQQQLVLTRAPAAKGN
jgi:hypothetical protein